MPFTRCPRAAVQTERARVLVVDGPDGDAVARAGSRAVLGRTQRQVSARQARHLERPHPVERGVRVGREVRLVPEPPKIPTLCPRPTVSAPSSTRTPVDNGSRIGSRSIAFGTTPSNGHDSPMRIGAMPSRGRPSASRMRLHRMLSQPHLRDYTQRRKRVPISYTLGSSQWHRQHMRPAKSYDFHLMSFTFRIHNFAAFAHRTQWSFRLDRLPIRLHHASMPSPCRTNRQPFIVGSKWTRRHYCTGLWFSRSKKPFSISSSCTLTPSSTVPIFVSRTQSPFCSRASPVTCGFSECSVA